DRLESGSPAPRGSEIPESTVKDDGKLLTMRPTTTNTETKSPITEHQPGERSLRRRLKLRHIVFLGLAYMAPLAVFDTFGIVAEATNGRVPLAYVLIIIAVTITALSYAKMSRYY